MTKGNLTEGNLADFVEEVTGESHLRIEDDLGDGFVRLKTAEAERRQAKHDVRSTEDIVIEMLRNARDAHARNIFVATGKESTTRRLTMIDDGDGIPVHMQKKIFEARVTSKLDTMHMDSWGVHGRGMALFAIKANAKDAFVAASKPDGGGSAFVIQTDTASLPEKKDQSTNPVFSMNEAGTIVVRGPKNIIRTIAEFAYIDRAACSVYAGSPVEIAATLWDFASSLLPDSVRLFLKDPNDVAVCKRLALSADPSEFQTIAASIGLQLSERSARRIMDGEIEPLSAIADTISPTADSAKASSKKKPDRQHSEYQGVATSEKDMQKLVSNYANAKGLKISKNDEAEFIAHIQDAYGRLAESYYLESDVHASMTVKQDRIIVTIPVQRAN